MLKFSKSILKKNPNRMRLKAVYWAKLCLNFRKDLTSLLSTPN